MGVRAAGLDRCSGRRRKDPHQRPARRAFELLDRGSSNPAPDRHGHAGRRLFRKRAGAEAGRPVARHPDRRPGRPGWQPRTLSQGQACRSSAAQGEGEMIIGFWAWISAIVAIAITAVITAIAAAVIWALINGTINLKYLLAEPADPNAQANAQAMGLQPGVPAAGGGAQPPEIPKAS